jgi:Flp pilus assembly protein TadD
MVNARPASPQSLARSHAWFAALVIGVAVLLAYGNTFAVPLIFDDDSSILKNETIRHLWTAWWPPNENGLTVSGRPFLNFTLALNYAAGGTAVRGYHAVNLLIHVLAGYALFGVIRRTLLLPRLAARFGADAVWLALTATLLWVLHPLQTESVTYIIQRAESLVGLLYLLTFWCFIRSTEPGASGKWMWLACGASALGMATKEVMVTAPVMIACYDRVFLSVSWREVWARHGRRHLAIAATWLVLAALVLATGNRGGTAGFGTTVSPVAYAITQIGVVADYLRLACWPQPLIFDYGQFLANGFAEVLLPAALLLLLAVASVYGLWRGHPAGYCGVFFFAVLAPTSSFVPVATQTMNEHRMYLPLAAVAVLFATLVYAVFGRRSLAALLVVALALGGATWRRNADYRTEQSIWEDTVAKRPTNVRALAALGAIQQREGRLDAALATMREAVRLAPAAAEQHNNLGNVWMKLGDWAEAAQCFRNALALKPADPFALNNLGNAYLQLGRGSDALVQLAAAVEAKPDLHEARYNLANTLAAAGRLPEAAKNFVLYLAARPDDAEARSNYGNVLLALHRPDAAVIELERAVRAKPTDAEVRNNFGVALVQAGRPAEGLVQFREAVRLAPQFQQARENAERAARSLSGG